MNGNQYRERNDDGTDRCNPEAEQGWAQVSNARAKRIQVLERSYAEEKLRRETAEKQIASLRAALAAAERELERWRHGQPVEGDYVCPNELRATIAESQLDAAVAVAAERERCEGIVIRACEGMTGPMENRLLTAIRSGKP